MEDYSSSHFKTLDKSWISSMLSKRDGEKKLGEDMQINVDADLSGIKSSSAGYVLLGISEDIGPRANFGRGGSDSAWLPFMKKLLNMQDNDYLSGNEILLAGYFDFGDLQTKNSPIQELRELTGIMDKEVAKAIEMIVSAGKIPIVIGGGHNNSYPLIKGTAMGLKKTVDDFGGKINSINLDPHADFRELEGRHSGNGFSYAFEEGYLEKYSIVALHESYNSRGMLEKLRKNNFHFSTYEDIFIRRKWGFKQAIITALQKVNGNHFGLELDLDSIENIPTSAETPCGISTRNARYYITLCAQSKYCSYFHIAEGAPSLKEGSEDSVGKLIAYLVVDFIKTHRDNRTILNGKNS